jgi:hypothetical protein
VLVQPLAVLMTSPIARTEVRSRPGVTRYLVKVDSWVGAMSMYGGRS